MKNLWIRRELSKNVGARKHAPIPAGELCTWLPCSVVPGDPIEYRQFSFEGRTSAQRVLSQAGIMREIDGKENGQSNTDRQIFAWKGIVNGLGLCQGAKGPKHS